MKRQIEILMLEDEPADAALIEHELSKSGLAFVARRVETESEFLDGLQNRFLDMVLSDHGLPGFDGFSALDLVQNRRPDLPFIFVSGRHGEEDVVDSLKRGATDYVLKDKLSDLAPAISRALQKLEEARQRNEEITEWRRNICLDILFASAVPAGASKPPT